MVRKGEGRGGRIGAMAQRRRRERSVEKKAAEIVMGAATYDEIMRILLRTVVIAQYNETVVRGTFLCSFFVRPVFDKN